MSIVTTTQDLGKAFRLWKLMYQLESSADESSIIGRCIKNCLPDRQAWEDIVELIKFYVDRNPKYIQGVIGEKALELYYNLEKA